MKEERIHKLKAILATTNDVEKRTLSLWMLLNNHVKSLTTEELLQYIAMIWEVGLSSDAKFFGIRQRIESELKVRQCGHTILKLLELLQNDRSYMRFVGADLLNDFHDSMIIEPLLDYLRKNTDDFLSRRQAICALGKYKDERIRLFLVEQYERNNSNQDAFFRANYLLPIEWMLEKYKEGS